jgi:hypothetical protein
LAKIRYSVSGTITKSDGGNAEGASVQLKQDSNNVGGAATTDGSGAYTIPNVLPGTYTIAVTLAGYVTGTISSVTVGEGNVTGQDLTLAKEASEPGPEPEVDYVSKRDKWGHPVKNTVYIEVNENDPRVALGYVLASAESDNQYATQNKGKQFFDHVVIFAANLNTTDKTANADVELRFNSNVQHILNNRDTHIKPLQDKGIKVLLGLLGNHDPVGMGTFQENPDANFPACNLEARDKLAKEIAQAVSYYGLDGVDLDDEWTETASGGQNSGYPSGGLGGNLKSGMSGKNMADFIVSLRRELGNDKIISVYEWHTGRYLPNDITVWQKGDKYYTEDPGDAGSSVSKPLYEFYDVINQASYGSTNQWGYKNGSSVMQPTNKTRPMSKYGPTAIRLDDENALSTINVTTFVNTTHNGSTTSEDWYGFFMWYNLQNRAYYANSGKWEKKESSLTVEGFISTASNAIFGQDVVYTGIDYPKSW